MNWEAAVRWYRQQVGSEQAILDNYFDLPVHVAAHRFEHSEEFSEVLRVLGTGRGRTCLDVGAGNGIASVALASRGWRVTALEPDPSVEVGAGAVREMAERRGLAIDVIEEWGEQIPAADATFDAVYARQVLHHARDLPSMLKEISRVLRRGGILLATREHVVDDEVQLGAFRAAHPLHQLYGGENAYRLDAYISAIRGAGMRIVKCWGPLSSIMNFYPRSEAERQNAIVELVARRSSVLGRVAGKSSTLRGVISRVADRRCGVPGRLYSFVARKL